MILNLYQIYDAAWLWRQGKNTLEIAKWLSRGSGELMRVNEAAVYNSLTDIRRIASSSRANDPPSRAEGGAQSRLHTAVWRAPPTLTPRRA